MIVGRVDEATTPGTDGFGSSLSLMDFQSPFPYPNQNIWDGALPVYHSPACVRLRSLLATAKDKVHIDLIRIFNKLNMDPLGIGVSLFRWSEVMTADDTGDKFRFTYLSVEGTRFFKAISAKDGDWQAIFIDFIHRADAKALEGTVFKT